MRKLLASLCLLAVCPVAAAAQPWSPEAEVAAGRPMISEPTIAIGGDGRALLSARLTDETGGVPSHGQSHIFTGLPTGAFAQRGNIVLAAPPAIYGRTGAVFLRLPLAAGTLTLSDLDHPSTTLGVSFGRTDGRVGSLRTLSKRADRTSAALAADPRGDVAAAWIEHLSGRDHLMVALRRPDGSFGRPSVLVGSGSLSAIALAWSARGDVVVAYQRSISHPGHTSQRRIEARVRRAGHSFGNAQVLGASSGFSEISAAAAPSGRMVVAWGTQDLGEEANTPWIVRAAERPAGPHAFHAAQRLSTGRGIARPAGRVAAAMTLRGVATVAWSEVVGSAPAFSYPVNVATAGSSLRFAAAQQLGPNGAVGAVASGPDGSTLVVWGSLPSVGNNQNTDQALASLRPAAAPTFGDPEPLGPTGGSQLPRAAFDPANGRPVAIWVRGARGTTQQLELSRRVG